MRFFCFALLITLLFSCSNTSTNKYKLTDFVPENTDVIIKTSNLESLKSSINNSDFLQHLTKTQSYTILQSQLEGLSLLKPNGAVLICFSKDNNDSLQYTLITKYHESLFVTDSLQNYVEESLVYKNKNITKSTLNLHTFYSTVIDSTFFTSSSRELIDAAFNKKKIIPI